MGQFGPEGPSGLTLVPCLQRSQISYKCHLVLRPIPELLRAPPERVWVAVPRRPPPSGGLSSSSDSEEEELEELLPAVGPQAHPVVAMTTMPASIFFKPLSPALPLSLSCRVCAFWVPLQ